MRRAAGRMRIRIENLIAGAAQAGGTVLWWSSFDVILLPDLRDLRDGGARQTQDKE